MEVHDIVSLFQQPLRTFYNNKINHSFKKHSIHIIDKVYYQELSRFLKRLFWHKTTER